MITDIQMPCSSGLELGKRCRDELGPLPVFIILTSFEDFQYAREAMSFRAADYLVKIDLSPESLTEAVKQAVEQVNLIRQKHPEFQDTRQSLLLFQERFYIKLLNNLFESREQFRLQKEEFEISLDAGSYAAATVQFIRNTDPGNDPSGAGRDIPLNIYSQTLQMFQELLSKYISCHILALDTHFLAAIFLLDDSYTGDWKEQVRSALENAGKMLHNYYGVSFLASIGGLVHDALDLSSSYSDSRQLLPYLSDSAPILFSDERSDAGSLRIGVSATLCRYMLLPYLSGFISAHPGIHISISCQSTNETLELLESDAIDIGLVGKPEHLRDITYYDLDEIEDIFVATDACIARLLSPDATTKSILESATLMLLNKNNMTRQYIDDYLTENRIQPKDYIEISSMDLLIEFARIGLGVACVIKNFVQEDLASGALTQIALDIPIHKRHVGFAYKKPNLQNRALELFLAFVK